MEAKEINIMTYFGFMVVIQHEIYANYASRYQILSGDHTRSNILSKIGKILLGQITGKIASLWSVIPFISPEDLTKIARILE